MKLLAALSLMLLAATAHAESPNEVEARRSFAAGQKAFEGARYEEALVEFERSHALSGYPAILHKIALCHDQLGHTDEAIAAYEKYLAADPKTERKAGIEARVQKLRAAVQPPPAQPKPPEPAKPSDTAKPADAARPDRPAAAPALSLSTPAPARRVPVYKRWWLWTAVGVAAVGLGVGLGVGLTRDPGPSLGAFGPGN